MSLQESRWDNAILCGGILNATHPVLFSADAKSVLVISGSRINVYNAATSQLMVTLTGHYKEVTAIILNPLNALQLYSASRDGTIKLWDYNDGVLLRSWDVNAPILSMVLDPSKPSMSYLATLPAKDQKSEKDEKKKKSDDMEIESKEEAAPEEGKGKEDKKGKAKDSKKKGEDKKEGKQTKGLSVKQLKHQQKVRKQQQRKKLSREERSKNYPFKIQSYDLHKEQGAILFAIPEFPRGFCISPTGDYLGAHVGTRHFYLYDIKNNNFQTVSHSTKITCLVFHPVEPFIAYGDKAGKVHNHYCLGSSFGTQNSLKSEAHWHAQSVHALAFSPDGNYMFTGGEEAVLVIWQKGTGAQQFLPRQGATIYAVAVSVDGLHFAISLGDNSVRVFSSVSLEMERSIIGLKIQASARDWGVPKVRPPPTGLVLEPRNNMLVLNGAPGGLQFYDPVADRNVAHLSVVPSPAVTVFNGVKVPETVVTKACFANHSSHLITVDRRMDPLFDDKMSLKFWQYDYNKSRYVVNTEVDNPHKKKVTGIAFHPKGNLAATCSLDGHFKLWMPYSEGSGSRVNWTCQAVGYYRKTPAYGVDFSSDGTILAVAYAKEITLWDPTTLAILKVLTHPLSDRPKDIIKGVHFVPGTPYVITHTPFALYVWNLLTCSIWWSYDVRVKLVSLERSSKGSSSRFVIATDQFIFLFDVQSPVPQAFWKLPKRLPPTGLVFTPATQRAGAMIIYLNNNMELVRIEQKPASEETLGEELTKSMNSMTLQNAPQARSISLPEAKRTEKAQQQQQQHKADQKRKKGNEAQEGQQRKEKLSNFERIYGKDESNNKDNQDAASKKERSKDSMELDEEAEEGEAEKGGAAAAAKGSRQYHNSIFDGPSHVIAAPTNLYMSFMEELLQKASLSDTGMHMMQEEQHAEEDDQQQQEQKESSEAVEPMIVDAALFAEDAEENRMLAQEFDKSLHNLNKKNYESILNFFAESFGVEVKTEGKEKEDKKDKKKKKKGEKEKDKKKKKSKRKSTEVKKGEENGVAKEEKEKETEKEKEKEKGKGQGKNGGEKEKEKEKKQQGTPAKPSTPSGKQGKTSTPESKSAKASNGNNSTPKAATPSTTTKSPKAATPTTTKSPKATTPTTKSPKATTPRTKRKQAEEEKEKKQEEEQHKTKKAKRRSSGAGDAMEEDDDNGSASGAKTRTKKKKEKENTKGDSNAKGGKRKRMKVAANGV